MDEFDFCPQVGATGEVRHRKLVTQFGDGYSQAVGDGINRKMQDWPLSFTGKEADIIAVRDFLDARGETQSFTWTPPLGVQGYYRADPYTITAHGRGVYQLTVTLKQVYRP